MVQAEVAASTCRTDRSVSSNRQHVGMGVSQPDRGRSHWCAQQDLEAMLLTQLAHPVDPGETVPAWLRLQPRPGELEHPDHIEAEIGHGLKMPFPLRRIPVLWVIRRPNPKSCHWSAPTQV